jgi:hypothetical protein
VTGPSTIAQLDALAAAALDRLHASMHARTHAPKPDLQRATDRYALCAWLSEQRPCELTESMRLNALWDVLRARAAR